MSLAIGRSKTTPLSPPPHPPKNPHQKYAHSVKCNRIYPLFDQRIWKISQQPPLPNCLNATLPRSLAHRLKGVPVLLHVNSSVLSQPWHPLPPSIWSIPPTYDGAVASHNQMTCGSFLMHQHTICLYCCLQLRMMKVFVRATCSFIGCVGGRVGLNSKCRGWLVGLGQSPGLWECALSNLSLIGILQPLTWQYPLTGY